MFSLFSFIYAGMEQFLEMAGIHDKECALAFIQWVAGSSPARLINKIRSLKPRLTSDNSCPRKTRNKRKATLSGRVLEIDRRDI